MKIVPSTGYHFATLDKTSMFEGVIYLGKYDSHTNYIEVTEEEYQAWLSKQQDIETIQDIERR